MLTIGPHKKLTLKSEVHALRLANLAVSLHYGCAQGKSVMQTVQLLISMRCRALTTQ